MIVDPTLMLALAALLLTVIGVYRLIRAWQLREIELLSRDQTRLASASLGLSGRPDRLIRLKNGMIIPVEKKSSARLHDSHRVQVGAYLLLIEEAHGVRSPYGVVVLGDGREAKVPNTAQLRRWVLQVADNVRGQRADPSKPARVRPTPGQCRSCSLRDHCMQRAA